MRADKIAKGQQVRITKGPYKGRLATVAHGLQKHKPGSGFRGMYFSRVSVKLTNGSTVEVRPRDIDYLGEAA